MKINWDNELVTILLNALICTSILMTVCIGAYLVCQIISLVRYGGI
jgi:hypothetical protein